MNFDQYRKEMKDQYNFTDIFIEAQIAYMVNHPEEQHRAEERMKERDRNGMETDDLLS